MKLSIREFLMQKSFIYRLIAFSQKHAVPVVLITAIISAVLGYFALQIEIDPDVWGFLPKQSEALKLIEEYGGGMSDDYLILAVESEEIFALDKLKALEEAIARIEAIPNILGSINPFNFITFKREGKKITPVSMSPGRQAPRSEEELEIFREKLINDPIARNFIISEDLTSLCSFFPAEKNLEDYSEILSSANDVLTDLKPHFRIYLAGQIPIVNTVKVHLKRDVPKFIVISVLVILLVLYFGFRSKRSVLLPLIVVSLGTVWTVGIMSLLGFKMTIVNIMVPPLVLTLGSSYSIHILNQYYREARVGAKDRAWIAGSVSHVNKTILLAALTTVIGFASLLSASLRQIREFGISTSLGITICAVLSLFVFPAILSKLRPPSSLERERVLKGHIARLMEKISGWVIKWRFLFLAILVLITVVFFLSLNDIRYQTDYMSYFRKKEKSVQDNLFVMNKFGGIIALYISIDAPEGRKNYFLDPNVLKKISNFEEMLKEDPDIAYLASFASYLKLMNLTVNGSFDIPEKRPLILLLSRYFKSLSSTAGGKAILGTLANKDFNRLTIAMRIYDSKKKTFLFEDKLKELKKRIEEKINRNFDEESKPLLWGGALVSLSISEALTSDQIKSVIVSVFLVFFITAISFRSLKFGFFTLIPMLTGIMLNFILMTLLDIPFDVVTIAFASVAIGVGIDDSIHLIIQYRKQSIAFPNDKKKVLEHTLKAAGRPILLTSISIIAGLLVLTVSSFMPILYFGLLVSLALCTTTIGALIILPAMLSL
ncbi:Multidrug resistance protein MdtC [subsurface metagenome]